jgi:hypothetical protein
MNINTIDPNGRTLYSDSVLNRIVTAFHGAKWNEAESKWDYDSRPIKDRRTGKPMWVNLGRLLLEPVPCYAELQADIRAGNKEWKPMMFGFTPAAFFAPTRNKKNVQHFTGLMPFDIDHKDNAGRLLNYDDLKAEISKLPYVAYCGRSLSGTGFWGLFYLGPHVTGRKEYKAAFEQLRRDFLEMGIIIDAAPSDPSSMRFYSYDPDAYVNHYPEAYTSRYIAPPAPQPKPNRYTITTTGTGEMSERPGAAFNRTHSPVDVLTAHGWQIVSQMPESTDLRRPGARTNNHDATYYADNGKVKIWSTSAGLPTDGEHTAFALLALMEYGGDFAAAARAIRAAGVV